MFHFNNAECRTLKVFENTLQKRFRVSVRYFGGCYETAKNTPITACLRFFEHFGSKFFLAHKIKYLIKSNAQNSTNWATFTHNAWKNCVTKTLLFFIGDAHLRILALALPNLEVSKLFKLL